MKMIVIQIALWPTLAWAWSNTLAIQPKTVSSTVGNTQSRAYTQQRTSFTALSMSKAKSDEPDPHPNGVSRRNFILSAALASPFLRPPQAHAGLLDDYGADPSKIENKQSAPTAVASSPVGSGQVEIDPSLRASYYYPAAKKRYLPRIQKVSTEIGACTDALLIEDWDRVQEFAKTAENAILPLQLYASSLDGQGLSMASGFAKQMRDDALEYEKAYKSFDKALKRRDSPSALQAVSDMGVLVADYRNAGRLKDDDGNIPSIDEMKSMTMRRPTVQIASTK